MAMGNFAVLLALVKLVYMANLLKFVYKNGCFNSPFLSRLVSIQLLYSNIYYSEISTTIYYLVGNPSYYQQYSSNQTVPNCTERFGH